MERFGYTSKNLILTHPSIIGGLAGKYARLVRARDVRRVYSELLVRYREHTQLDHSSVYKNTGHLYGY